jgi:hypothetical protein
MEAKLLVLQVTTVFLATMDHSETILVNRTPLLDGRQIFSLLLMKGRRNGDITRIENQSKLAKEKTGICETEGVDMASLSRSNIGLLGLAPRGA